MSRSSLPWAQARRLARDRRFAGDDLRSGIVGTLSAAGDARGRFLAFLGSHDQVGDLAFRVCVLMMAQEAVAEVKGRDVTDEEAARRLSKVARDLDISRVRLEAALAELEPFARLGERLFSGVAR